MGAPSEIVELTTDVSASPYYSRDMAPVPAAGRKWGMWDMAALWVSMSACIPTYMLASSLIDGGMNWWQAVLTIFLGNVIVLIPMILNAHAGTRYGIPFPGLLPGVVRHPRGERAGACCGPWSPAAGSASRPGSAAWRSTRSSRIYGPRWQAIAGDRRTSASTRQSSVASCSSGRSTCSSSYRGIDSIRVLLNIKAPLLIALGLLLLAWAYDRAGGFGPILSQPSQFVRAATKGRAILGVFLPRADRQRRLLGDAVAEHPRLLALRPLAARSGPRPDDRPADDDGACTRSSAWPSRRRRSSFTESRRSTWDPVVLLTKFDNRGRAGGRDVLALPGDAGDQHRGQRRQSGERFRPPVAQADRVPHRRPDHRHHRQS